MLRRDDQNAKEEVGIQGFDFEITFSVRPGALAAIRIAGGSYISGAEARPGRINENGSVLDGLAVRIDDFACEVWLIGRRGGYEQQACR
jgi:hypothetical protein